MAIENITIDASKRLGNELRQAVTLGRAYLQQLRKVKVIMDRHTDGADWATLESQFGVGAGAGQLAYNLTAGALAAGDVTAVNNFLDRLG